MGSSGLEAIRDREYSGDDHSSLSVVTFVSGTGETAKPRGDTSAILGLEVIEAELLGRNISVVNKISSRVQ